METLEDAAELVESLVETLGRWRTLDRCRVGRIFGPRGRRDMACEKYSERFDTLGDGARERRARSGGGGAHAGDKGTSGSRVASADRVVVDVQE